MQKYPGIDPVAATMSPELLREALFVLDRQLRQIVNSEQGDSSPVPTVREDQIILLNDLAVPVAAVENAPGGRAHFIRCDTDGNILTALSGVSVVDTELPAAVTLSDAMANPTAPSVGAHLLLWDATAGQWKRGQCNTDGEILVAGKSYRAALSDLEGDYVTGSTTKTATGIDCREYTLGSVSLSVAVTGAPTSLALQLWFSNDGGSSYKRKSDTYWANNILDDTSWAASGDRLFQFDCSGVDYVQIVAVAVGVGAATPKFTVSDADIALWVPS